MERGGILAVRQDSIGDVILAGPAIRALAASGGPITLLCGARGAPAAALLPGVDSVLTWTAPWIDPAPGPVDPVACEELIAAVRRAAPREAVVFTSFHQSPLPTALLLRLAEVPRIAAISSDYPGALLDVRHQIGDEPHEVERALSLAAAAGHGLPAGDDGHPRVDIAALPPGIPRQPYLVLHPGAAAPARAWEPRRWAELAAELDRRGHGPIVVTGALEELALTGFVAASAPGAIDLGGRLALDELAAVLAGASAVAIANTGPAHLAAAVGTPVASLFAPTVPVGRWRPYGVRHEILHRHVPCAGCRARICPVEGHPCLDDVRATAVADALERVAGASLAGREEALA